MSSFLISRLKNLSKENLNFILDIKNEKTLDDISKFVLSKNNKEAVLFLIENNKISKSLSLDLFKFIVVKEYWDMFLKLDYTKFDIHTDDDYALRLSSKNGSIEVVKFLVEKGANIHAKDDYALSLSSLYGHIEVVQFLIKKGANIHANDDYVLKASSKYGHIDIVKFSVEKGANIHVGDDYAIRWSSQNGHLEVVKFLVEKGANIHANNDDALITSNINGYIGVVKILLNSDLEYFCKNRTAHNIVKRRKLIEFYKKFGINIKNPQKISQTKNDIMNYINSNDLESLKICNEFDFSMDGYYYFFESLTLNNIEINQTIFGFIKDKEDLRNEFNNICPFFDDVTKDKFQKLFKNEKINELKKQLEKLKEEFIKLESQ